jgi:ubiquinone/menaquinone biosynthesis C-methylase UbiE
MLSPLHPGPEGSCVWDEVWTHDRYGITAERVRRARRRWVEFSRRDKSPGLLGKILDIGCGTGDHLLLVSQTLERRAMLYGVDFSERAVRQAMRKLSGRAIVCVANVHTLPFSSGCFSTVTAFGVIEHVSDARAALAEIARVLAPGGSLYLTTSNYFSVLQMINVLRRNVSRYPYGYQRNWQVDQLCELISKYLDVVSARTVQTDWDTPFVKIVDLLFHLISEKWGRYIYLQCRRKNGC